MLRSAALASVVLLTGCIEDSVLVVGDEESIDAPADADAPLPAWATSIELDSWEGDASEVRSLSEIASTYDGVAYVSFGAEMVQLGDGLAWHTAVITPVPEGTRLLPIVGGEVWMDAVALLPNAGTLAYFPGHGVEGASYALESAAPSLADDEAREATVAMRWMKSCPISREPCLLYGPPAAVQIAIDPEEPPGGWFLDRQAPQPAPQRIARRVELAPRNGAQIVVDVLEFDPDGEAPPMARVSVIVDGHEQVAFDAELYEELPGWGERLFGVERFGDKLAVWYWPTGQATYSVHDLGGQRVEAPVTLTPESYYDIDCGMVYNWVRPLLVDIDGAIEPAIWFGGDSALVFDAGTRFGRPVPVVVPEDLREPETETMDAHPATLRLSHGQLVASDAAWEHMRSELALLHAEESGYADEE